jgi:competence protein ComEC
LPHSAAMGVPARVQNWLSDDWARAEGFILWAPVWLALGIGAYFALTAEPLAAVGWLAAIAGAALGIAAARARALVLGAAALALFGFGWAQVTPLAPGTPMLAKPLGPVEVTGRIVALEPLEGTGARVLLAPSAMERHGGPLPRRVRLKVHDAAGLAPGRQVTVLARLIPPGPPVAPGAFDFQRHAYFQGIGAVGFAYRVQDIGPAPPWWRAAVEGARARANAAIARALDGPQAAMAMALITGTKSAMERDDADAMRNSGMAHMLAISGLHVGMVAGIVFFALRLAMAAWPALALTHPIKKYAAAGALLAAVLYMLLAGAPVSAQRATVMTAVALAAIMADRWPFSLRVVAGAALAVLVLQPAALTSAGFQMSFAAVAALIYVFERAGRWIGHAHAHAGLGQRVAMYFVGVLVTDLVASVATTAFSAYHFQQVANYTLLANFTCAPIFAFWVMPAAVLAMLAMPLGLEGAPLWAMGQGVEVILAVARWVAALPGALTIPVAWPPGVLFALAAFGLGVVLLRGWAKGAALVPLALCVVWAAGARPPDILVDPSGALVGLYDGGALYVSDSRRARFAREVWERRAGLPPGAAQPWDAAPGMRCDADACRAEVSGRRVAFVWRPYAARAECAWADVLIAPGVVVSRGDCPGPVVLVDRMDVYYRGAHAVDVGRLEVRSVGAARGARPWTARHGE